MTARQREAGAGTAVTWHSEHAREFGSHYDSDRRFEQRYRVLRSRIQRHSHTSYRAMDLGCGTGPLLPLLAAGNADVVGLDGSGEMLELSRKRVMGEGLENVSFVQADIAGLGRLDLGRFDLIVSSSVLEYLDDLDAAVRSVAALLKPAGTFLCSVPNRDSVYRRIEPLFYRLFGRPNNFPYVRQKRNAAEMAAMFRAAGLAVRETAYFASTPILSPVLGSMGLARLSENLLLVVGTRDQGGAESAGAARLG